jgi:hypothetical protein
MADRRTVDELTIEELEQLLIVKRREARADRMRRLAEIGRLPTEAALPHEDLANLSSDANGYGTLPEADSPPGRPFEVEPIGRKGRRNKEKRPARSRQGPPE